MNEKITLGYKDQMKRGNSQPNSQNTIFAKVFLQRFPGSTETKLSLRTIFTFFYTTLLQSDQHLLTMHLMAASQPTLLLMYYQPSILHGYIIHITKRARCNAYLKEITFLHTFSIAGFRHGSLLVHKGHKASITHSALIDYIRKTPHLPTCMSSLQGSGQNK